MPNLMEMTPEQLAKAAEIAAIAQQNDAFRRMPVMHPSVGRWVMTAAICAEGETFCDEVIAAVRDFDAFTEEMDPYGEHAMGRVEVQGKAVWWKIDLYDRNYEYGSPSPAEITETRRVLTILFPSDY